MKAEWKWIFQHKSFPKCPILIRKLSFWTLYLTVFDREEEFRDKKKSKRRKSNPKDDFAPAEDYSDLMGKKTEILHSVKSRLFQISIE